MTIALLVIDFQKGLVATDPLPGDAASVSANVRELTQRARAARVPVIFVQHEDDTLVPGSEAWQIADAAQAQDRDYFVSKRTPDSYLNTALGATLTQLAIQHVVICGYASEFCVDTTTRRAAANGFTVTLVADAHTTHDPRQAARHGGHDPRASQSDAVEHAQLRPAHHRRANSGYHVLRSVTRHAYCPSRRASSAA